MGPRPRAACADGRDKGLAVSDDERPNQGASASGAGDAAGESSTAPDAAQPDRRSGFDRRQGNRRQHRGEKTDSERRSGLDRRVAHQERRQGDRMDPDAMSLGRRMRQPRTIISLILPIFLLILFAGALPGFHLDELPALILGANGWLLLAAFVVYYLGFPLRGLRWAILVRGTGYPLRVGDSTEIIFISWLVNCLVPAKLGDLYRAYLLKINSPVSLIRTFGTVFIERVLDLFAIVVLGLRRRLLELPRAASRRRSRSSSRSASSSSSSSRSALLTMRNFGRRVHHPPAAAAPRPGAVRPVRGGRLRGAQAPAACRRSSSSPASSGRPRRCGCSSSSRRSGFSDVHIGISGAFFVALTGVAADGRAADSGRHRLRRGRRSWACSRSSTAIGQTEALAIVLVDRAISVLSVIVFGSIAYCGVRQAPRRGPRPPADPAWSPNRPVPEDPTPRLRRDAIVPRTGALTHRIRTARVHPEGRTADPSNTFESLPVIRAQPACRIRPQSPCPSTVLARTGADRTVPARRPFVWRTTTGTNG